MRFQIDSGDQIRITNEIEARGEEIGAIFHSHPNTEACPSQTDVNLAALVAGGRLGDLLARRGRARRCASSTSTARRVEEVELVVE